MYSNEEIVAILKAVYVEHKTKKQVANDFQMHWNTVYNICRKYGHKVEELKRALQEGEEVERIFVETIASRTRKVTEEYQQEISRCCIEYFSCQRLKRNPEGYIRDLCNGCGVKFSDIIDYDSSKIDISDILDDESDPYQKRRRYLENIKRIRKYRNGIKNYSEVYEALSAKEIFKKIPISFDTFYYYARRYWEEDVLGGRSFGEYIDEKYRESHHPSKNAKSL